MIKVTMEQVLKWNYTVKYYNFASLGFSGVGYDIRKSTNCDMAVQSFFVVASRDACNSACSDFPATANVSAFTDGSYEPYNCCTDFSYPFYTGGWSIMSKISTGSTTDYIKVFFQVDIVNVICVCVIACFGMAHLIWLLEKMHYGKNIQITNP